MTTAKQLWVGFGTLLVLLLLSSLLSALQLAGLQKNLTEITAVTEPASEAAYEMEITALSTGMGVLQYLDTGDPKYRGQAAADTAAFREAKARYDRLTRTPDLGQQVGRLYQDFRTVGERLMDNRDRLQARYVALSQLAEQVDDLLLKKLHPALDRTGSDGVAKMDEAVSLRAHSAAISAWMGHYRRTNNPEYRQRLAEQERRLQEGLKRFANLPFTEGEKPLAAELVERLKQILSHVHAALALHDSQQKDLEQFLALRADLDGLLDQEIQKLTKQDLTTAKDVAETNVQAVRLIMGIAFLVSIAIGGVTALVVGRRIVKAEAREQQARRAVEAGKQRYQDLVDDVDAIVWEADAQVRLFRFVSRRAEQLLGYPVDRWQTEPDFWINLIHPHDRDRVVDLCRAVAAGEGAHDFEYRAVAADGRVVWLRDLVEVVPDGDDEARRLRGVMVDITARRQADADLRESEARKTGMLEAALDAVVTIDHEGKIVEFNPAAEKTFGRARDDVLGREMAAHLVPPRLREQHRAALRQCVATGESMLLGQRLEMPALRADGTEFPVELAITRIPQEGPPLFTAFLRDISERKRSERRVAAQHAVTRILAGAVSVGEAIPLILRAVCECLEWGTGAVWTVDRRESVLRCLDTWHLPTVHAPEFLANSRQRTFAEGVGLPGRVWASGEPAWIVDVVRDGNFPRAPLAAKEGLHGAFGFPIRLGREVLGVIEFFSQEIRQPDEDLLQMMDAVGSQIGQFVERKRAEKAMRENEEWLQQLADAMPQIVWSARPEGTVDYFNQRWYEFTGAKEGDSGQGMRPVLHPDDQEVWLDSWARAVRTGEAYQVECRLHNKHTGLYRWHLCRALPVRGGDGEIIRWYGTCTDVDQQKRTEEALMMADRRKDQFLAVLSHELRNPLAPIRNALQILRLGQLNDPDLKDARDVIDRQVQHLAGIVEDLLDVFRIAHQKMLLRKEPLDLAHLVRQTAEDYRSALEGAPQLKLIVEVPDEPIWVHGDRRRLCQVVINLLNNAAKYTNSGDHVSVQVEIEAAPQRVRVTVRDTGIGIAPELLPHVFETFTQGEQNLDRGRGGLGLGLPLVKGLVELHGGKVDVASAGPGRGTELTFWLPLGQKPKNGTRPPAAAASRAQRLRILVVEDNVDAARTLAKLLTRYGHEVHTVYNGADGVEAARAKKPEVVLCDLGLPEMDGYEVARTLRSDPDTASMRLIAVSGYGTEEDYRNSEEAGFDLHLTKPVDPVELQRLLTVLKVGP